MGGNKIELIQKVFETLLTCVRSCTSASIATHASAIQLACTHAQVEMLLEAANWAPTHNLTQPWRFVVLEGCSKAQFERLTIELVQKYTQVWSSLLFGVLASCIFLSLCYCASNRVHNPTAPQPQEKAAKKIHISGAT